MTRPRFPGLTALLLSAALLPGAAHAVANFDGWAALALTLTGINGAQSLPADVSIQYATSVDDQHAFSLGRGATATTLESLFPLELADMLFAAPLRQDHTISGWAGDGSADARLLTSGLIFMTNASNVPVTFNFSYGLDATVDANADPLGIQGSVDVTWLLSDIVNLVDYAAAAVKADAVMGPRHDSLNEIRSFNLTLPAKSDEATTATLASVLDTSGIAEAPEPPVWALLAAGFAVASAGRRRPRRA